MLGHRRKRILFFILLCVMALAWRINIIELTSISLKHLGIDYSKYTETVHDHASTNSNNTNSVLGRTQLRNFSLNEILYVSNGSDTHSNNGIEAFTTSPGCLIAAAKNRTTKIGNYKSSSISSTTESQSQALHVSYQRIPVTMNDKNICDNAKLEFVHIPKTGGSAIELAATQVNITWGKCHFATLLPRYAPGGNITPQTRKDFAGCFRPTVPKGMRPKLQGEPWHLPPAWLRDSGNGSTTFSNEHNFYRYANTALFAVIRNPYTKMISEYYCPWNGYHGGGKTQTPLTLNKFLQTRIQRAKKNAKTYGGTHMIPQVEFIFNMGKNQQQVVDHVLFKENFAEEMERLMIEYDMPPKIIQLLSTVVNGGKNQNERMTLKNLTLDTVQMINDVYKNDFNLLGYGMIPTQSLASNISISLPQGSDLDYDIRSIYMP